jgi:hypothetical protein
MKILQITALALCLNIPMAKANDNEGCYSRFSRSSSLEGFGLMIGLGSTLAFYGMYRINSALNRAHQRDAAALIQQPQQQNDTLNDVRKGLASTAVGIGIATCFWINMTVCESIAYNNKCN